MRYLLILFFVLGSLKPSAQPKHKPYVAVGGGLHTSLSFNRLDNKWLLSGANVQIDYAPASWFSLRLQSDFLYQPFLTSRPVSTKITQYGMSIMPLVNLNFIDFDQGSLLLGPVAGVGYVRQEASRRFVSELNEYVSPGPISQGSAQQLSIALGYRHKFIDKKGIHKHEVELLSYINNWIYNTLQGYRSINFLTIQLNYRYVL